MPELGSYGSVRGARGNSRPYREPRVVAVEHHPDAGAPRRGREDVGISTACAIYAVRPDACKACLPGDGACQIARARFNL